MVLVTSPAIYTEENHDKVNLFVLRGKRKEERKSKLVSLDSDKESWKMSSILGEIESEKNCPFFIYVFAFSPIFLVRNCQYF